MDEIKRQINDLSSEKLHELCMYVIDLDGDRMAEDCDSIKVE